jgi:UDP-N-acetylmuramate: L-alanyl-gamma-D-glutamyl-meso-diaminopimelate ligase
VRLAPGGFEVTDADGRAVVAVHWSMPGAHNAENALAAMLAARHAGVPLEDSARALAHFKGVRRRQEWIGSAAGIDVYDDFAHHPTAIARTLEAMDDGRDGRRLVAVFEPRSNTMRMGVHVDALATSLAGAGLSFVFAPEDLGWDAAAALAGLGDRVQVCSSLDGLLAVLLQELRTGDRVVLMSNGSFGGLHGRLLEGLAGRQAEVAG